MRRKQERGCGLPNASKGEALLSRMERMENCIIGGSKNG